MKQQQLNKFRTICHEKALVSCCTRRGGGEGGNAKRRNKMCKSVLDSDWLLSRVVVGPESPGSIAAINNIYSFAL